MKIKIIKEDRTTGVKVTRGIRPTGEPYVEYDFETGVTIIGKPKDADTLLPDCVKDWVAIGKDLSALSAPCKKIINYFMKAEEGTKEAILWKRTLAAAAKEVKRAQEYPISENCKKKD